MLGLSFSLEAHAPGHLHSLGVGGRAVWGCMYASRFSGPMMLQTSKSRISFHKPQHSIESKLLAPPQTHQQSSVVKSATASVAGKSAGGPSLDVISSPAGHWMVGRSLAITERHLRRRLDPGATPSV